MHSILVTVRQKHGSRVLVTRSTQSRASTTLCQGTIYQIRGITSGNENICHAAVADFFQVKPAAT